MKYSLFSMMALLLLTTGCTSVDSFSTAKTDLKQFRRLYILTAANDSNHLAQLLANEFIRRGFVAEAGVRTMMPEDTQLTVSYEADWNWDFRTYLMRLDLSVRDAASGKELARGHIFHPGVTGKSPEKMINELLDSLLASKPSANLKGAPREVHSLPLTVL
jgi:hypothetical protein